MHKMCFALLCLAACLAIMFCAGRAASAQTLAPQAPGNPPDLNASFWHLSRVRAPRPSVPRETPTSACVHLVGTGNVIRVAIVPAGFDDADPNDVTKFQALAKTIADGFARTLPYASMLDRFSISRADDFRGRVVNPETDEVWQNSILIQAASVCDFNQIIVIAHNSGWAGGTPGFYSVVGSGTPPSCNQATCTGSACPWTSSCSWDENIAATALHETGHTIAALRHMCVDTQYREIERLQEMERVPENAIAADEPINCGVQSTGNPDVPCVEWNRSEFLSWVRPQDPHFGCYATCDKHPEWYRAWNDGPNIMCIDYDLQNGFTPVDRKLLADRLSQPNLRPYAPPGYAGPVVPSSRQGTHDSGTLYANSTSFFDWHFINENGTAMGNFQVELWVDGTRYVRQAFANFAAGAWGGYDDWVIANLPPGPHTVKLIVDPDNAVAESNENDNVWEGQFYWDTIQGWKGEYYNNEDLTGDPVLVRDDGAALNFDWQGGSPDPLVQADHFSARWTDSVDFPAGSYRFDIFHDDGARLYIDGVVRFENWCNNCRQSESVVETLAAGTHELRLEIYENAGWAGAGLGWVQVSAPQLYLHPAPVAASVNQIFTLDVQVDLAMNVADTVDAYIDFDPNYLEVVDAAGNLANVIELNPALFGSATHNSVDNAAGQINFSASSYASPFLAGSFRAATIRFKAKAVVASTQVVFVRSGARWSDLLWAGGSLDPLLGGTVVTVSPAVTLHGRVALPPSRGAAGDPRWATELFRVNNGVTIEGVEVYQTGTSTRLGHFAATTDAQGKFAVTLTNLTGDLYDIQVKGSDTLSTRKLGIRLSDPEVDFGTLPVGDSNGNDCVNGADVSYMIPSFLLCSADPGYRPYGDTNKNGCLNGGDVSALIPYFLQCGLSYLRTAQAGATGTDTGTQRAARKTGLQSATSLALDPPTRMARIGDIFTMGIKTDIGTLTADTVDAYINFDPAVLEVVDAAGNPASSIELNPAFFGSATYNKANNTSGQIDFSASTYQSPYLTGAFTAATVRFKVKLATPGTTIQFVRAGARWSDLLSFGESQNPDLSNSTVTASSWDQFIYLPLLSR